MIPRHIAIQTLCFLATVTLRLGAGAEEPKSFSVGESKYGVLPAKLGAEYDLALVVTPVPKLAVASPPPAKTPAQAKPASPKPAAKGKAPKPVAAAKPASKPAAPPPLRLLFSVVDPKNHYQIDLTPRTFVLSKVVAAKASVLSKGSAKTPFTKPYDILVKRRADLLTVVVNGAVLAETMDDTFTAGSAALEVTHGVPKLAKLKAQKVGPIHESDDFMVAIDPEAALASVEERTAVLPSVDLEALSGWDKVSGEWKLFSVMDEVREVEDELLRERIATSDRKPDAARSSNPFSMSGKASNGEGIVLRGHTFWDNYVFTASANSSGSQFGLIFYCRSPKDYFLLEWAGLSMRERSQPIRLVRVTSKGREVLATAHARSKIDQWYSLGVETYGQRIQCYLDGARVFDVTRADAVGGRIGFLVRGQEPTHFDDVAVDSTPRRAFDSAPFLTRHAQFDKAAWRLEPVPSGIVRVRSLKPKPTAFTFGADGWRNCRVEATARPATPKAGVGLAAGPLSLQWDASGMRLTLKAKDGAKTLASASSPLPPNKQHRLALDLIDVDRARVYVDDRLVLRGRLPSPVSGKCSLLALGEPSVLYSDVQIAFERAGDRERPVDNAIFTEDPYMLHWSSPQGAWVPVSESKSRFWHKGDFFGDFSVKLPFSHGTQLLFCTSRAQPGSDLSAAFEPNRGYAVSFNTSQRVVAFDRLGKRVKTLTLPRGAPTRPSITIARSGRYVSILADKHELMEYRDPSPPVGRRVALQTGTSVEAEYFADVLVERDQVRDDYFDRAPVDWHKVGKWEVINRFACDPRWSHMTALSENDLAIIRSKAEYEGDFTLEFYAGNKMWPMREWVGAQYYPRVGDINCTICADDADLDSGYTVTLAEWDNKWSETWTRLRRGTRVVAESDRELIPRNRELYPSNRVIPVPWLKKGRGIHGAWYYIKLRKIGNRIEYYFDNELVLSFTDPKPLSGRRIAIWTQDDYVTFARAKVSYDKRNIPNPVVAAPKAKSNGVTVERFAGRETAGHVAVTSPTHPGASFDFEGSFEGWTNIDGPQGALLELERTTDRRSVTRTGLRVTNMETGGHFGVRVPVEGMRLSDATLQFYYRLDADAKVNIYLKFDDEFDRWHFVQFSGGAPDDVRMISLGALKKVRADGRWRPARFALGEALRQARPWDSELRVKEMRIGYFHEGYLRAGIGGNHKGTSYGLDRFHIASPGPAEATIALRSNSAKGYSTALSQSPQLTPASKINTKGNTAAVKATAPGQWYFHVRACDAKGKWTPTTHFAFNVEAKPLQVYLTKPQDKANWGGSPIHVYLTPRTGPNIAQDTLRLTINGKNVEHYPGVVAYNSAARQLAIRVDQAPLQFTDGRPVKFALEAWTSAGQAVTANWTYTMRHSLDKYQPAHVRLLTYPALYDFDEDTQAAAPLEGAEGALLSIDRRSRRAGRGSLKAVNVHMGGSAGVLLLDHWLNLGSHPIVSFDYRIPKTYRLNLLLDPGGQAKHVRLTDPDTRATNLLHTIEGAEADDTWRHAEVNLAEIIREKGTPSANMFDVSHIAIGDTGYQAVGPNMGFYLDNFVVVPTVSAKMGVDLKWEAYDPTGIKGYRYRWSTRPNDTPYLQLPGDQTEKTFYADEMRSMAKEGEIYFHLSAQDGQGRRSTAKHYRFIIDNTAPQCGTPEPFPGSRSASPVVKIPVSETGSGVDLSSLQFEVNGHSFTVDNAGLSFDTKKGELTWDWTASRPELGATDGTTMHCKALGIRDYAGNLSPAIEWTWTLDHGRDSTPPEAPQVKTATHRVLTSEDFEHGLGEWMGISPSYSYSLLSRVARSTKPADYCVQVSNRYGSRAKFGAYVGVRPFHAEELPIVSFDYCFQHGVMVDLALQISVAGVSEFYIVKLTAPEAHHKVIGSLSDSGDKFTADSKWHKAWIDLRPMLRKAFPKAKGLAIETVAFGDFGANENNRRAYYRIDNFMIAGPGAAKAQFSWTARDLTGIKAYRIAMDQTTDTEPSSSPAGDKPTITKTLSPGMWYLHAKAQDGAGNWGPTAHCPYFVSGPAGH